MFHVVPSVMAYPTYAYIRTGQVCHVSDENSTKIAHDVALKVEVMEKSLLFVSIVLFAIVFASAKPIPQLDQNDLEYSAPGDSGNRAFWFGRPYYDENDDGGDNNFNPPYQQPSPTVSYTDIGGGWGR